MPAKSYYENKLRELGMVLPGEKVSYIQDGNWKQHGQFFVSRMAVGIELNNGRREDAYWLKCPYDFFTDLDGVVVGRVMIAQHLRKFGCNIPRTARFEPATMIQEEVVGRLVPYDGAYMPDWAKVPVRREMELYEKAGYKYMDGSGDNFIVDDKNRAWCIDLDFNLIDVKSAVIV